MNELCKNLRYWGYYKISSIDNPLRNIDTGAIAYEDVNNDMFLSLGKTLVEKMEWKNVFK